MVGLCSVLSLALLYSVMLLMMSSLCHFLMLSSFLQLFFSSVVAFHRLSYSFSSLSFVLILEKIRYIEVSHTPIIDLIYNFLSRVSVS